MGSGQVRAIAVMSTARRTKWTECEKDLIHIGKYDMEAALSHHMLGLYLGDVIGLYSSHACSRYEAGLSNFRGSTLGSVWH